MNYKKIFWRNFAIGFPLGVILCMLITVITSGVINENGHLQLCVPSFEISIGNAGLALIIQIIVSGLYGAIIIGATVAYEIEKWSILRSTATHAIITLTLYYLTGFTLHWFRPTDIKENLIMLMIFIVVYVSIWLFNYFIYKSEVRKINSKLKELKDSEK